MNYFINNKGAARRVALFFSATCLSVLLTACLPALDSRELQQMPEVVSQVKTNAALRHKIQLGQVRVVDGPRAVTGALSDAAFRDALDDALRQKDYIISSGASYKLDAEVLEVKQPMIGFNYEVVTKVHYTLTNAKSGKTVYNDVLTLPYTAVFGEAMDSSVRMRIATARALRENIMHFLRILATLKP